MAIKKDILIYPDERIKIPSTDVREFDNKLAEVMEAMKETIKEYNLEGLAAIQISYPYNIVLVKDEDEKILELINPRIIKAKDTVKAKEKTLYYPDIEIEVPRYKKIKLVYEDRYGNQNSLEAEGKLARVIQRKIDYTFGGTFLAKVDKSVRRSVEKALADKGMMPGVKLCPTVSKRVYFLSLSDKVLFLVFISLFSKFFGVSEEALAKIYLFDKIAIGMVFTLLLGYFIYGRYEARKYSNCTSCQIGNMLGSMIKRGIVATLLGVGSYYFINPHI